jgi:hypothetical protein
MYFIVLEKGIFFLGDWHHEFFWKMTAPWILLRQESASFERVGSGLPWQFLTTYFACAHRRGRVFLTKTAKILGGPTIYLPNGSQKPMDDTHSHR